jgi:uncharacterized protein
MTQADAITRANPILAKFRAALTEMYGDRLERVVLYGSRARGDARPDSDYDVAIFLNGMNGPSDRWAETEKIADLTVRVLDETGAVIHAMPFPAGSYQERTLFMHELRREGLDL